MLEAVYKFMKIMANKSDFAQGYPQKMWVTQ